MLPEREIVQQNLYYWSTDDTRPAPRLPEDSLRFSALWLHEFGELNLTPNEIIAEGTDWRFLNELKRELKA
jgi:hypothetical protein